MTGERVGRRLAALLAADVAGYSRLMGLNEEGTLARLKAVRKTLVDPTIAAHGGRIVKTTGDGMLVEFASAVDAVRCAVEIQRAMSAQNADVPRDVRIEFRIGIHVGDIIIDDNDIFGDGVNIAARLESIAEPGGVCISDDAQRQVRGKVNIVVDDMGPQSLKNIAEPMRAWRMRVDEASALVAARDTVAPLALPDKPSIAVLPFQNMSGDPEQDYFADGMVEDIITALSRFKSLFVIARNSSFTYKGKAVDIKQVGRELGVRYVLEGSVRKAGQRARITGQLIDAESGTHLWADRFEGALDDIFELQDNVTRSVVGAIAPRLIEAGEASATRKPPEKWDSYNHNFRALTLLFQGDLASVIEAKTIFHKIIDSDAAFAPAYAGAAASVQMIRDLYNQSISEHERIQALQFAERAIKMSPDDETVLTRAAYAVGLLDGKFERGGELARRATALNVNSSPAWNARGTMELVLGELEDSLESFANAMRLSPLDRRAVPLALFGSAAACLFSGRYQDGAAFARRMRSLNPNDIRAVFVLIGNTLLGGEFEEAETTMDSFRQLFPDVRSAHLRQAYRVRKPEYMSIVERVIAHIGLPE